MDSVQKYPRIWKSQDFERITNATTSPEEGTLQDEHVHQGECLQRKEAQEEKMVSSSDRSVDPNAKMVEPCYALASALAAKLGSERAALHCHWIKIRGWSSMFHEVLQRIGQRF
mmetsp:Transcript_49055/g.76518  ORF Transcript_49055/g.76518 Transcript_49055/m.76518 type:complete len:114 (+) Transcript_49055:635-976(+)